MGTDRRTLKCIGAGFRDDRILGCSMSAEWFCFEHFEVPHWNRYRSASRPAKERYSAGLKRGS